MKDWNSDLYLKFSADRTRPAIDLVKSIPLTKPTSIIDIGCGPGNSTDVLKKTFPLADITGADSSFNMLETAKKTYPDTNFLLLDASKDLETLGKKYDIVFSNACIQWIPQHKKLIKNMMNLLNENGVLAVQLPYNMKEPIHNIINQTVKSDKWTDKFKEKRIFYRLTQEEYFDILAENSSDFRIWETTYYHRMKSHESIMEWYKSTGLYPYLAVLNDNDKKELLHDVYNKVVTAYPASENGEIIFKFPRLFFIAIK